MDTLRLKESVCNIETEICHLHQLIAAEERGLAALQSGEAPSQHLKPKMPLLAEVLNHVNSLSVIGNCNVISRQVGAEIAYNYITRHIEWIECGTCGVKGVDAKSWNRRADIYVAALDALREYGGIEDVQYQDEHSFEEWLTERLNAEEPHCT